MPDLFADLTALPDPQYIMSAEGHRIATYSWGEDAGPTVLCVHGFASSTRDNWVGTGWVRELTRAGYRVLALDLRGHGASDKPRDPRDYPLNAIVNDVEIVLDTYLVDRVFYLGYSLGARVGWQVAIDLAHRVERVVLGGVPDGRPLTRLKLEQAHAYAEHGIPVTDPDTQAYVRLVERVPGNDILALLALADGMRLADDDPDVSHPPVQPVLFATGTDDAIIAGSRALAAACPQGSFVEIPGRHHFNAPGSRFFRAAALEFFARAA